MLNKILLVIIVTLFIFVSSASAKDLFVATDGSDATSYASNDIDHPWLTVEHAWATAQNTDVVYYRTGTYTITTQIDNVSSGAGVTHMPYNSESVTWSSSLCTGRGLIFISEDNITVDGIDITWTGLESCYADTGFFMHWDNSKGYGADGFTIKNSTVTIAKYGQNGGLVYGGSQDGDPNEDVTIENVKITGPGKDYGTMNSSGIINFEGINWTIKNCEISDVNSAIFYNKHPNLEDSDGGLVQNNYFHDVNIAVVTQANYATFDNNIFIGNIRTGEASGANATDGNEGSDHNTWTHNTFITTWISLSTSTSGNDNELVGATYGNFENNLIVMSGGSFDVFRYEALMSYYTGDYNLFTAASTIYFEDSSGLSLSGFQTALGGCPNADNECNSIEQSPTFVGGASPSSIAEYALTAESYGYQACADSSDMGADVSLVGTDYVAPEDTTAPEFSSATINGTSATITLSEDVVITNLDDGDFKFTGSMTGEVSINSCTENNGVISGTAASTFVNGETVTCAYSGDANEVEDTSSNSLDTFSGELVTNNTPAPSATGNITTTVGSGPHTITINPAGNCTWSLE